MLAVDNSLISKQPDDDEDEEIAAAVAALDENTNKMITSEILQECVKELKT